MKIAVLGTTPMTKECILEFKRNGWEIAAVVSLPNDKKKPLNSMDLKATADQVQALYYETEQLNEKETENFLQNLHLDYIFSTWPYIICENILNVPKYFVIGSHPTQLPNNRGRHPLHWLISMGIPESYVSFFLMDQGVDSGNILVQERFSCICASGIQDVYENMVSAYKTAIIKLSRLLKNNPAYQGVKQNDQNATYWRKRGIFDVMIDFRMQSEDIVRLVKSFNDPYECAVLLYKINLLRIADAQIEEFSGTLDELRRIEPGKIVCVKKDYISIKAADRMIRLYVKPEFNLLDLQFGQYIYPPSKYIVEYPLLLQELLGYTNVIGEQKKVDRI